jgi:hypothetical protein
MVLPFLLVCCKSLLPKSAGTAKSTRKNIFATIAEQKNAFVYWCYFPTWFDTDSPPSLSSNIVFVDKQEALFCASLENSSVVPNSGIRHHSYQHMHRQYQTRRIRQSVTSSFMNAAARPSYGSKHPIEDVLFPTILSTMTILTHLLCNHSSDEFL